MRPVNLLPLLTRSYLMAKPQKLMPCHDGYDSMTYGKIPTFTEIIAILELVKHAMTQSLI